MIFVNWKAQNIVKGVETEPRIFHAGRFKYYFHISKFGDWFSIISEQNTL